MFTCKKKANIFKMWRKMLQGREFLFTSLVLGSKLVMDQGNSLFLLNHLVTTDFRTTTFSRGKAKQLVRRLTGKICADV